MLRDTVIPAVLNGENRGEVTFWSVGCSSGEETYSLALILKEYFSDRLSGCRVRILGSDISAEILDAARTGIYRPDRLEELPEGFLSRYFTPDRGMFRLHDEIREMVEFQQSDLLDCASFPPTDLIVCRNLLIYFDRARHESILKGFAAALSPGGFLLLGKSETLVGEARKLFTTVCPVERIYRLMDA
jgi:chemotaxis protein methyltransferase CheR